MLGDYKWKDPNNVGKQSHIINQQKDFQYEAKTEKEVKPRGMRGWNCRQETASF